MLLKTYSGPDLASALAMARAEMGPDALVLATREVPGRFGLAGIEVTVGAARPGPPQPRDEIPAGVPPSRLDAMRRRLGRARPLDAEGPGVAFPLGSDASDPAVAHAADLACDPALAAAVPTLVAAGVSEDLATRFARIASRRASRRGGAACLADAAEQGISEIIRFAPIPLRSRCLFVVGPPGSGKTTTVAKLAARLALGGGRSVVFAEADVDRIGSVEQARIFSCHVGAKLVRLDTPRDVPRALEVAGEDGMVLVDTPGVGARDADRVALIAELRDAVPGCDAAILVPAGLHRDEAARVLERFAEARPTCAAFSRVDDGARVGELVTALAGSKLPLSFLTTGHRVPDDLEGATPRGLAAILLRSVPQDGHPPEACS